MANNYLLVFPYQVTNKAEFESILDYFEENDYIIHLINDISPNNFDLTLLPVIIQEVIKDQAKRIVVCSNVRELIFSWYRCYNHLVHDYIYVIDEFSSDLLAGKKEYAFYQQLFNFIGIEEEKVNGRIYINISLENCSKVSPLIFNYLNFKYFARLNSFDFDSVPEKSPIQKEYFYEGYLYTFERNNPSKPVFRVHLDPKSQQTFAQRVVLSNLSEQPDFLFLYLNDLLRSKNPEAISIALNCFRLLQNKELEERSKIQTSFLNYMNEVNLSFHYRLFFLSLLVMLRVMGSKLLHEIMETLINDNELIKYHYPMIANILFYRSRDLLVGDLQYYSANRKEIVKIADYINFNPDSFPKLTRKKKKIAFLVDQLLSLQHSPTKVTLDYIKNICKADPEYEIGLFVEDNFNSCPEEIIVPYGYSALESWRISEEHHKYLRGYPIKIEYSDSSQSKIQRVRCMVRKIAQFDPGVIITTSDISLSREILYPYFPVIYFSLGGFNYSTLADAYLQVNLKEAIDFYKQFHEIKPEFIHEFKYGLDLPKPTKRIKREEFGFSQEDCIMVTVGNRLDAELDEEYISNICQIIQQKANLKWLIVGAAELKYLVNNYKDLLGKKIIRLDYEKDLMALYDICDIYINPRRHGGGISIAMAMDRGLPVVIFSNPSDGLNYVGEENGVGYDYSSYLNEIDKLYSDPNYRFQKAILMKKRIATFSMQSSVSNLLDIINIARDRYFQRTEGNYKKRETS